MLTSKSLRLKKLLKKKKDQQIMELSQFQSTKTWLWLLLSTKELSPALFSIWILINWFNQLILNKKMPIMEANLMQKTSLRLRNFSTLKIIHNKLIVDKALIRRCQKSRKSLLQALTLISNLSSASYFRKRLIKQQRKLKSQKRQ